MDAFDESLWLWEDLKAAEEAYIEEHNRNVAGIAAALIVTGDLQTRANRAERRQNHRAYFLREDLLPDPRVSTPWQQMYESSNDKAFIVTMGVDVNTFHLILRCGFQTQWDETTIPRADVSQTGAPRPGRRSLDAAGALGLILHYLNSTMREVSLQQIFALVPASVSRYIDFALDILLYTVRRMREARVAWPHGDEFEVYAQLVQARHPHLFGAFGSIDGLNLPCQTSSDIEIENATYNGWLHEHFISSVLVFSPKGTSRTHV